MVLVTPSRFLQIAGLQRICTPWRRDLGNAPRPCAMPPASCPGLSALGGRDSSFLVPGSPALGGCSCPRQGFYCERSSPFHAFGEVERLGQDLPQGLCKLGKRS